MMAWLRSPDPSVGHYAGASHEYGLLGSMLCVCRAPCYEMGSLPLLHYSVCRSKGANVPFIASKKDGGTIECDDEHPTQP